MNTWTVSLRLFLGAALILLVVAITGCGGETGSAPSSSASGEPAGDLTLFAYEDGFVPKYIEPFKEQYPSVNLRTSVYDSGD